MKTKHLLISFLILLLSSCKLYTAVVLEKTKPGEKQPYPIIDTTLNAVKVYLIDNHRIFWTIDKNKCVEFNVGDTITCFFKEYKTK
jgi:hypothetical protein